MPARIAPLRVRGQSSDNDWAENLLCCFDSFYLISRIMDERDMLRRKLADLETQHRDLDDVIARISESVPFDQLQVQRLKKRKLRLKDEITRVRAILLPDIIA